MEAAHGHAGTVHGWHGITLHGRRSDCAAACAERLAPPFAPQLLDLSRLEGLCIQYGRQPGASCSSLTRLPALTRLELRLNRHLPACLGQLTGLQALVSREREREINATVSEAENVSNWLYSMPRRSRDSGVSVWLRQQTSLQCLTLYAAGAAPRSHLR